MKILGYFSTALGVLIFLTFWGMENVSPVLFFIAGALMGWPVVYHHNHRDVPKASFHKKTGA